MVNDHLRKNHLILEEILGGSTSSIIIPGEKLQRAGFSFQYHTHAYTTRKGSIYYFCYDHGYLLLESGNYLIVKEKRDHHINDSRHEIIQMKVPERRVNTRIVPALQ